MQRFQYAEEQVELELSRQYQGQSPRQQVEYFQQTQTSYS